MPVDVGVFHVVVVCDFVAADVAVVIVVVVVADAVVAYVAPADVEFVAAVVAACSHFVVVVAVAASSSGAVGGIAASVGNYPQAVGDIQIDLPFSLLVGADFLEPCCPRPSLIRKSISWPQWTMSSWDALAEGRQSLAWTRLRQSCRRCHRR